MSAMMGQPWRARGKGSKKKKKTSYENKRFQNCRLHLTYAVSVMDPILNFIFQSQPWQPPGYNNPKQPYAQQKPMHSHSSLMPCIAIIQQEEEKKINVIPCFPLQSLVNQCLFLYQHHLVHHHVEDQQPKKVEYKLLALRNKSLQRNIFLFKHLENLQMNHTNFSDNKSSLSNNISELKMLS